MANNCSTQENSGVLNEGNSRPFRAVWRNVLLHYQTAFLIGLFGLFFIAGFSQVNAQAGFTAVDGNTDTGLDSIRLEYRFTPGQEITYRVLSTDSIVLFDETPFVIQRQRIEHITFRCDTILPDGYGMTVVMNQYVAREKMDTMPEVTLTSHQWLDREIKFLMSPYGERIRLRDYQEGDGVAPGEQFQPLLLPFIGDNLNTYIGASDLFELKHWLLDNVYPPVEWIGGVFRVVKGYGETLGVKTYSIELSETGHVEYLPPSPPGMEGHETVIQTVVNSSHSLEFAYKAGFPVAGKVNLIGNLTFKNNTSDAEMSGRHFMTVEYSILPEEDFE